MLHLMDEYIAQLKAKDILVLTQDDLLHDVILGIERRKYLARFIRGLMGRSGKFETVYVVTGDECFEALDIDPRGSLTKQEAHCYYELDKGSYYIALRREGDLDIEEDNLALLITYDAPRETYDEYYMRLASAASSRSRAQDASLADASQALADRLNTDPDYSPYGTCQTEPHPSGIGTVVSSKTFRSIAFDPDRTIRGDYELIAHVYHDADGMWRPYPRKSGCS